MHTIKLFANRHKKTEEEEEEEARPHLQQNIGRHRSTLHIKPNFCYSVVISAGAEETGRAQLTAIHSKVEGVCFLHSGHGIWCPTHNHLNKIMYTRAVWKDVEQEE
ncbi:hypothetical protein ILYODFUR_030645 [Ilyodon furcidens]|uniref:Uncharacterized protein n=1 Tax=Ilyodon furcidens TaxID=33524 RepID=A0ABV0UYW2_9TELE